MTKQRKRTRGNGEGSIVKLGGKRKRPFAVRITVGWTNEGKQLFKYVGYYESKTKAKEELNKFLINPYDLNKITTLDLYDKWAETSKFSEDVLKNYKRVIENSGLSKKVFKDISLMQLEDAARELSPSMQKRYRSAWKNLYEYGMRHNLVNKNLADLMQVDKYVANKREAINPSDVKKILKGDDDIAKLLLFTGMRIGELLDVKSKNINLEKRIIIGGLKTEAGKNRKIPIHKSILPIIENLLSNNTEYLITDEKGKKVKYNNYLTEWHKNDVLTKYSPHYTRHTFISRAVKLELNQQVLKAIVGHSSSDVTSSVYTHIDDEQLLQFIDLFNYN